MSGSGAGTADAIEFAAAISRLLRDTHQTIAVAESLTSGMLATRLGAAEAASEWFRGGVVAYSSDVKFTLLGVNEGPVISARCAEQMAIAVRRLMSADVGVAVTGAGGPGDEEGNPPGTVFVAVCDRSGAHVQEFAFAGDPELVVHASVLAALKLCQATIEAA